MPTDESTSLGYFAARRAEAVLKTFRSLTLSYWEARPPPRQRVLPSLEDLMGADAQSEPREAAALRSQIEHLVIPAQRAAESLGAPTGWTLHPPVGSARGPMSVDVFTAVVNPQMIPTPPSRRMILSLINEAVGAAEEARRAARNRALSPWWWIVDWPAAALRVPFLILRAAGVPRKVEENVVAHIAKILLLLVTAWLAAAKGLNISVSDLTSLLK